MYKFCIITTQGNSNDRQSLIHKTERSKREKQHKKS